MSRSMKKPPMRLVISVVAVVLVAIAVPFSVAVADGMNAMIGGGTKTIYSVDKSGDLIVASANDGNYNPAYAGEVVYTKINSGGTEQRVPQTVFYGGVGELHEFIITAPDATYKDGGINPLLSIQVPITPEQWMDNGITGFDVTMSTAHDMSIKVRDLSYSESTGIYANAYALAFMAKKSGVVYMANMPVDVTAKNDTYVQEISAGYLVNLTSEARTFRISPANPSDVIRAANFCKGADQVYMSLVLNSAGSETSKRFQVGDYIAFDLAAVGKNVNGFSVSNIIVGVLGLGLIVGAVFATPWVGRDSFAKAKRKISRKGRR